MTAPGIGHVIYSTKRRHAGTNGEPFGGIVVARFAGFDPEWGEMITKFATFDHQHNAYLRRFILTEDEIDSETAHRAPDHVIVNAWRRLALFIAETARYKLRKGKPNPDEAWCCQAMSNLMALVFGPEGVLHAETDALVTTGPAPRPSYPVHPGLVDD